MLGKKDINLFRALYKDIIICIQGTTSKENAASRIPIPESWPFLVSTSYTPLCSWTLRLSSSQASSCATSFSSGRLRIDFLRRVTRAGHEPCYLRTCRVTSLTNNGSNTKAVTPCATLAFLSFLLCLPLSFPLLYLPVRSGNFSLYDAAHYVRTDAARCAKNGLAAA